MKINRSKEWWMNRADNEGNSPVSAGLAAPAETPTWEHEDSAGSKCRCEVPGCNPFVSGAAPAPLEPVKPPRCLMPGVGPTCGMYQMFESDCKERCLYRSSGAPAPGVGEGRDITFAEGLQVLPLPEVVRALQDGVALEYWARSRNEWEPVPPNAQTTLYDFARVWATSEFRRRPEPLPAPAPRVSRVQEMVLEWLTQAPPDKTDKECVQDLAERVVDATLKAVRDELGKDFDENCYLRALDRARAAMLETKS